MHINGNCSLPSKVNGKFVWKVKCRYQCIIYEVKCSICDDTQQTFKKRIDRHFSDLKRLLKNRQKSDSFSAHFVQHFNTTMSGTDIRKYMTFKVANQINLMAQWKHLRNQTVIYVCSNVKKSWISYVTKASQLWTRIRIFMGPVGTKWLSVDFA